MSTMTLETVITKNKVFNILFDKDLYLPTIEKYGLESKSKHQLDTWMRKTGNNLEGEEYPCALRYFISRTFTNMQHVNVTNV